MKRFLLVVLLFAVAMTAGLLHVTPIVTKRTPRPRIVIEDGRPVDHPIRVAKETAANALAPLLALFSPPIPVGVAHVELRDKSVRLNVTNSGNDTVYLTELRIPAVVARQLHLRPPDGFHAGEPQHSMLRSPEPSVVWVGNLPIGAKSNTVITLPSASGGGYFQASMGFLTEGAVAPGYTIGIRTQLRHAPSSPAV